MERDDSDEMQDEYDFSGAERGRQAHLFDEDTVMVVLDPDVAAEFPTPESVNVALRALGALRKEIQSVA